MEEKAVFGLDFIFQVAGAAHAKALWLVKGNTKSSMWLEQNGGEWWGQVQWVAGDKEDIWGQIWLGLKSLSPTGAGGVREED